MALLPFPGAAEWNGSMPASGGLDVADWIETGATVEHITSRHRPEAGQPAPEPSPSTYEADLGFDDPDEQELIAEQLQLNEVGWPRVDHCSPSINCCRPTWPAPWSC